MKNIKFHFTLVSGNRKTGPIPVTTTEKSSCPDSCPFKKNGCYAEYGPLNYHWMNVEKLGISALELLKKIKKLPKFQLWRHNQAGDLPHYEGKIDSVFLDALTQANKGKRGFTYTHHELNADNVTAIKKANRGGFTVNVSANNMAQAIDYQYKGLPVVCVVPSNTEKNHGFVREKNSWHVPQLIGMILLAQRAGFAKKLNVR